MRVLTIITIALLCLSASCKKKNNCARAYILEHPMSVYPIQESYNIGDTIWIEMNFSDVFTLWYTRPTNTEEYLTTSAQLKDFNFSRTILTILKLSNSELPLSGQEGAFTYFQTVLYEEHYQYQMDNSSLEYKYDYSNGYYSYKLGLICVNSGNYSLGASFISLSSPYDSNTQDITPECEKERIYKINFPVNRQSDGTYLTNYHLYEQLMNPALETDIDRIQKMGFTFKVN